jgi:hypothetical protein
VLGVASADVLYDQIAPQLSTPSFRQMTGAYASLIRDGYSEESMRPVITLDT